MAKLVLDMAAASDDFFEDTAMIGIVSAQPGYRFCWILNNYFEIGFGRDPEQKNIDVQRKDKQKVEQAYNFPVYQYDVPNSTHKYLLYKLKDGVEPLLPETKHLDYIWLIQSSDAKDDALFFVNGLKNIPDVQLAQVLQADQLKNLNHLLV